MRKGQERDEWTNEYMVSVLLLSKILALKRTQVKRKQQQLLKATIYEKW